MKADEIAEKIGYYLTKHGTATTKGAELIKEYARQKCKEQREICSRVGWSLVYETSEEEMLDIENKILNAPEPKLD